MQGGTAPHPQRAMNCIRRCHHFAGGARPGHAGAGGRAVDQHAQSDAKGQRARPHLGHRGRHAGPVRPGRRRGMQAGHQHGHATACAACGLTHTARTCRPWRLLQLGGAAVPGARDSKLVAYCAYKQARRAAAGCCRLLCCGLTLRVVWSVAPLPLTTPCQRWPSLPSPAAAGLLRRARPRLQRHRAVEGRQAGCGAGR